jgi:short-subunit dehydrogenase
VDYGGVVVLLTGASSGIGRDAALGFAKRGATVVAVARREERLRALVDECRESAPACEYFAGDVGEREFAEGIVRQTFERHGRLDVLVNNAAVPHHQYIFRSTPDDAERVLRINFLSCIYTTFAALPLMLRQGGGTIVNVSSFASRVVAPRESLYGASKAAMDAFTEGLWNDLAGTGIHAALIHPGAIDTEIWDKNPEPSAYKGKRHPPALVTKAIFSAIERRRHELLVPKLDFKLRIARLLRQFAPAVLRAGMRWVEPVPPEWVDEIRREQEHDSRKEN